MEPQADEQTGEGCTPTSTNGPRSARRVFERLRDEYGYSGCYSQVQTAIKEAKQYSKEAFVPLSHPPGHAQFDFGEAVVEIAGERRKAALGVITVPALTRAIETALRIGATGSDAVALILFHHAERPVGLVASGAH